MPGGGTGSYGAGQVDAYLVKLGVDPSVIRVPADQPTIQAGINAAQAGDIVLVDEGTYYENINFKGKAITVASGFFADGDTSHISNTIIDGSQPSHPDSGSVVSFVSGEDTTSILCGFTITNGSGTINTFTFAGEEYTGKSGGGVFCFNSGATILDNRIQDNHVSVSGLSGAGGGGITVWPTDKSGVIDAVIQGNTIVNNSASGGEVLAGGISLFCNARVLNNTISYNSCTTDEGWAIGGGMYCATDHDDPNKRFAVIENNIITHNTISSTNMPVWGGGVFLRASRAIVRNNTISLNEITSPASLEAYGAGLSLWSLADNSCIDANTISHNVITQGYGCGSGICLYEDETPSITNNIVSYNAANRSGAGFGGGIYCRAGSHASIINNTIVYNDAYTGGGIYSDFDSHPIILNTIIWDNQAESDAGIYGDAVIVAYSDIQGGWEGEGNMDLDPLFADTMFHLSFNSPCIGAGSRSIEFDGIAYTCPNTDCECKKRPNPDGSNPDIAAYELPREHPVAVEHKTDETAPSCYLLTQNYPNPFNPTTTIAYDLPNAGHVRLVIYDVLGRRIRTLVDRQEQAGRLQTSWDGTDEHSLPVAGGLYFCRMQAGKFSSVVKMVLVR